MLRIDKSAEPIIALTKGATMKTDENLNIPDADGDLPLVDAALFGASSKLVRSLSERGADVNAVDAFGGTPLIACGFETAGCSARKVARLLIKAGADPHLKRQIGEKNVCFTDMIRNVPYFEKIAEYCEKQRKE